MVILKCGGGNHTNDTDAQSKSVNITTRTSARRHERLLQRERQEQARYFAQTEKLTTGRLPTTNGLHPGALYTILEEVHSDNNS